MGKSAVHIGCIISSVCMLGVAYARDAAFENAPYMNPALSAAVPEPSWRLDFEKDGERPAREVNVEYVDGIDGTAAHIPTNGVLEYAYKQGALHGERGTVSLWFKMNWTPWGGKLFRDKSKDEDGNWTDNPKMTNKGAFARSLLGIPGSFGIGGGAYFTFSGLPGSNSVMWNRKVFEGEWHHVAVSWDVETDIVMYLDGIPFDRPAVRNKKPMGYGFGKVLIGCGAPRGLDGAVDRVRFWDRQLTDDEVLSEFAAMHPHRLELLDWTVPAGGKKSVRFRARELESGKLKEFTKTVAAPATQGCFRVTMLKGTPEQQTFELYALGREIGPVRSPTSAAVVAEYDCTKSTPANLYIDCGSHIVTNGTLVYREADNNKTGEGMLYRFHVEKTGVPYRLEVDYPDDAQREYSVGVYPYFFNRFYLLSLDCFGIHSGWDHPVTGKMQTKELIFWPDSKDFAVGILGYRTLKESRPPAVARLRLYEADLTPSRGELGVAGGSRSDRTVGIWEEDPTMDAGLAFSQCVNYKQCDLDFWRIKWERVIEYMRYMGINTWVFKAMSYGGDVTDMGATLERLYDAAYLDGRVPGWAELGSDMLDRAGMDFWARLNHKLRANDWIPRLLGIDKEELQFRGADGLSSGYNAEFNVFHPTVFAYFKRIVAAYRDKFGVYPHFRGIMLNENPGFHFGSIKWGYDDTTVGMFERETGVKVPGKTCADRYAYLAEGPGYSKWIEWRCRKVTDSLKDLVSVLRDGDGYRHLRLQFVIKCDFTRSAGEQWPDYNPAKLLLEAGIDIAALKAIDGLDVIPSFHPQMTQTKRRYLNDEYIPHDPRTADAYGHDMPNMFIERHSNLEIYPSMTKGQGRGAWKGEFWWPYGCNVQGEVDFQNYATPHPDNAFALAEMAAVVADYDVQDLLHGFWGIPESGAHSEFRRFYRQLRSIPREKFALLKGWTNDPVAIRVNENGYYLVNRLWAPVSVSYRVGGKARTVKLDGNELRYFAGGGNVSDVHCEVDAEYLKDFKATLDKMHTILSANPGREDLKSLMAKIDAAVADGRLFQAYALTTTRVGREARNARAIAATPWFDWKTGELVFRARNYRRKPFKGGVRAKLPAHDWKPLREFTPLDIPVNGVGECRIPYDCAKDGIGTAPRDHLFRFALVEGTSEEEMAFQFDAIFSRRDGLEASGWSGFLRQRWCLGKDEKTLARLGKNDNVTTFSYLFDPDGRYLKFHAEVQEQDFIPPVRPDAMYTHDSLQLYFDQLNNARFDTGTGYDEDDAVFQIGLVDGKTPTVFQEYPLPKKMDIPVSVIRRADGKTVYDVTFPKETLPFADLRPRHGNVIGAGLLVNDRCKDAAGEFSASYQSKQQYNTPKNWKDLYLSYERPGCNALIILADRKPVKASVASGSVVDEYMPTADGVVSCKVSAEWGSLLTLEDVVVEGAEVSRRPELPLTLPYPKSAELKLKVKAGVPVKVSAKVKITTGE